MTTLQEKVLFIKNSYLKLQLNVRFLNQTILDIRQCTYTVEVDSKATKDK